MVYAGVFSGGYPSIDFVADGTADAASDCERVG